MATGGPAGAYHAYGQRFREALAIQGIELVLRNTAGSVENLTLLKTGEVDVAFMQGGSVNGNGSGLQALGSLYFEPLWLFHRAALPLDRLDGLQGLRVAVGTEGSGTRELVLRLLADAGLTDANVQLVSLGGQAAADALRRGELDAVFLVSGAESALVQALLHAPQLSLASLERAAAYTRRYRFLSELSLPEGAMDLKANLPPRQVRLVAPAAGLVAGPELHPAISDLLLQAADDIHGKGGWFEPPGQFPSAAFTELPLSKEAERYYKYGPPLLQRYLPFWAASLVDRLKVMLLPLVVLLLPFFKVMPPIYTWRMRARIYRWYRELERIDLAQHGSTEPALRSQLAGDLNALEEEVMRLEVPLSFASQLYHLRQHIDLVRSRVKAA
jgi:TRAP-type uncharacterized transport system substrate-binding protein